MATTVAESYSNRTASAAQYDEVRPRLRAAFEVLLHGMEAGSAARWVQGAINWTVEDIDEFYARGVTDEQLGLAAFRSVAERIIGAGSRWFTSWRVRLGVKG
jgi:hypothetical protein